MPAAGADDEAELPAEPGPARPGTAFVIDFDLAGFIAGLGIDCGSPGEQDAIAAAGQAALADSPAGPAEVPGRGADLIPPGPALAAWLAAAPPDRCAGYDLPAVAAGYRRLATATRSRPRHAAAADVATLSS